MKKLTLLLIVLAEVIVYSCQSRIKVIEPVKIPIESNASLTDFISSCDDIVIESGELCLFSNIDKLCVDENNLYILDRQLNAIFVYNKQGMFINKLSRQGRGPQEYLYISDFEVNKGNLYVLSRSDKKILIYNSDMLYVSDIKLNDWYNDLFISNDNSIFLYSERANAQGFDIVVINSKGDIVSQYLPFPTQDSFKFLTSPFNSYKNDGVFITLPYENQVYTLLNGDCKIEYEFNFNTSDHIKNIKEETYSEIRDKFKGKEILKRIEYITEEDGNVLMVCNIFFNNFGYRQLLVLLNKDRENVKVLRLNDKIDANYPFFGSIIAIHDKMIYSLTNTETIANIANTTNKSKVDVEQIEYNFIIQASKIKFE
ncbi:hypothetical protein BN938_2671 [Mucinivorans hirudinis]|uniref:6-bladed beta-propeller n=1 Tax=Mucinivorans hirudinis TaxID=1433126 RepID=A0A060RAS6_9BACT|nr:hypothetical protein BN938_2671 [Mucinivorans hirudinis]